VRDFLGSGRQERVLLGIARSGPARILTNSYAVAQDLEGRGVPGAVLVPIHNGVDLDEFSPAVDGDPFRRECGFEKDAPLAGLVAMLAPWKGHMDFVEAAAQVARQIPRARFPIIGEEIYVTEGHGRFRRQLRERITALGMDGATALLGRRMDMPRVMAALDVSVHASSRPEPFGRVLIEAMAAGKPVVATAAGGVPEIVTDGETGLLVPPGEPAALAAAIRRLLIDPCLRERLGNAGRREAEARFDIRIHAERIQEVYRSVLDGDGTESGQQPRDSG
jgi:glycosyltransferase involved in cell wall biosynthesis